MINLLSKSSSSTLSGHVSGVLSKTNDFIKNDKFI